MLAEKTASADLTTDTPFAAASSLLLDDRGDAASSSSSDNDEFETTARRHVRYAAVDNGGGGGGEAARRGSRRMSAWAQLPYVPSRRATLVAGAGLHALAAKRMSLFSPTSRNSITEEAFVKSPTAAAAHHRLSVKAEAIDALKQFADSCCLEGTTALHIDPLLERDTTTPRAASAVVESLRSAVDLNKCCPSPNAAEARGATTQFSGEEHEVQAKQSPNFDESSSPTTFDRMATMIPSTPMNNSGPTVETLQAQLSAANRCIEVLLQLLVKMTTQAQHQQQQQQRQHEQQPSSALPPHDESIAQPATPSPASTPHHVRLSKFGAPLSPSSAPAPVVIKAAGAVGRSPRAGNRKLSFAAFAAPTVLMPPSSGVGTDDAAGLESSAPPLLFDDGASEGDAGESTHQIRETTRGALDEVELGSTSLNQYILLAQIGQGAQGEVFYAVDTDSGEARAIKAVKRPHKIATPLTPSPRGSAMDAVRNMQRVALEREVAVMKRCRHRNLVSLHEVIDDPELDSMYLVMQFVEHGPLLRMQPNGRAESPLSAERVVLYGRQLCGALRYLHAHGVLHRDIKPENILLGQNDQVYLADFGLAELFDADSSTSSGDNSSSARTVQNTMGTLPFQAPELLCEGARVDGEAVDVWALGMTLYVFLFGRLPFPIGGTTRSAVIDSIVAGNFSFEVVDQPFMASTSVSTAASPHSAHHHSPAFPSQPSPSHASQHTLIDATERALFAQVSRVIKAMLTADPKVRPTATAARKMLKSITLPSDDESYSSAPAPLPPISVVNRRGSVADDVHHHQQQHLY